MKPRIYKKGGLWHCRGWGWPHVGLGFTPRAAYDDWNGETT